MLTEKSLAAATHIMDEVIVTKANPSQVRRYNANRPGQYSTPTEIAATVAK